MDYGSLMDKARAYLIEATQLDSNENFELALPKYTAGIEHLMQALNLESDDDKRERMRNKISNYMSRAETLKSKSSIPIKIEFDQLRIKEDSIGITYEKIFSRCLDNKLTEVFVEDPYISALHQVYNFLMFCELLIEAKKFQRATNLRIIHLTTTDRNSKSDTYNKTNAFKDLISSLDGHEVKLFIHYKDFHDREIKFDNGWTVKIGRGLDIYQSCGQFSIGSRNFGLRKCKSTIIDYIRVKR